MRLLATSAVMGSILLIGTIPEAAGQSTFSNTYIHLVDNSHPQDERGIYIQRVKNDMHEWQQKLQDFDQKVEAKGRKDGTIAGNDLKMAWTRTETEAHRLQTAGAEGWDSAKTSYENASHRLSAAWDRIRAGDK